MNLLNSTERVIDETPQSTEFKDGRKVSYPTEGFIFVLPILAILTAIIIRPQDFVAGLEGAPLVLILILPSLVFGLARKIISRWSIKLPQNYFLLAFLVMILVSNVMNGQLNNGLDQLLIFSKRAAFYLVCILYLDSMKKIRVVMDFIVVLSVLLAIQGIDQARTGIGWAGQHLPQGYTEIRINWIGDWDGPNVLALLFVIALAFCFEYFLGRTSKARRAFGAVAGAFLLYGIFLTNSRGGYIAMIAMLLFYFRSRFKLRYAIPIGILAFLLWQNYAPGRMSGQMQTEASAMERLWIWEQGVVLIRQNLAWGVGKGRFTQYSYEHLLAHNNYIQTAAEVGLIGFFFWVGMIYFSLKGTYRLQRPPPGEVIKEEASIGRGLLAAMMGFCAATMFVTMELDVLYLLWGLCGAAVLASRQPSIRDCTRAGKLDFLLVGASTMGVLVLMYLIVVFL